MKTIEQIVKGEKYIFNYKGKSDVLKKFNGKECIICAKYIGADYVGIKFSNGIETTATLKELN